MDRLRHKITMQKELEKDDTGHKNNVLTNIQATFKYEV